MKGLDRFEGFAERLIEGPFHWLLGRTLQPVDIARRLARVMDDHQTIAAGKVFVPNRYQVFLHPDTLAGFASYQRALEEELANFLVETAQRREFTFVGRPQVALLPDAEVRREALHVKAQLVDSSGLEGPLGHTQDLPVDLIRQALEEVNQPRYALRVDQREIPLDQPTITLGRTLDNDVILDHPTVSRRHAQIHLRHGQPFLRDLNSRNGTFVNGQRVSECVLRDGDRLALGEVRLLVVAVGPRLSARPPARASGPACPDDRARDAREAGEPLGEQAGGERAILANASLDQESAEATGHPAGADGADASG